jgi:hypothetical protein
LAANTVRDQDVSHLPGLDSGSGQRGRKTVLRPHLPARAGVDQHDFVVAPHQQGLDRQMDLGITGGLERIPDSDGIGPRAGPRAVVQDDVAILERRSLKGSDGEGVDVAAGDRLLRWRCRLRRLLGGLGASGDDHARQDQGGGELELSGHDILGAIQLRSDRGSSRMRQTAGRRFRNLPPPAATD